MGIYFFLIFIILIIPLLFYPVQNRNKRNMYILFTSVLVVFLLMALKAPSVGKDITGYKKIYELMRRQPWLKYDISWMEWGYEFLMMVFTHVFHASFQVFMICTYAFVYFSYYVFLRRYSEDYTTSIILYICFTFLTFDMSAIRTMLGVAICLFAVPYAKKSGYKNVFKFILITLVAAQIHKSAYIFFIVYFVVKVKVTRTTAILYLGIPAVLFIFRSQFYTLINTYFKTVEESTISLGGNLLVYILCLILTVVIWRNYKNHQKKYVVEQNENALALGIKGYFENSGLAMRMIYVGIILQLFGSGTVLTRMAQYVQIFILILIPNNLARLDKNSRMAIKVILYILAIAYFTEFSLLSNALDIVPYRFFWSAI